MGREKTFTEANFDTEVLGSSQPVLVDFWAEWCGPCRMLGPVIERIAEANEGKLVVGKLNVDENSSVPQKYGIQGIPTMIIFKGGEVASQLVGFQSQEKIQKAIDSVI
ncbi:MAG TPA: thioredoxin [Verrucomicrobiae bacterium]|jgi:thioredoxin 1|nr:thioredoxin [Verrucomicrobiae bacterium]